MNQHDLAISASNLSNSRLNNKQRTSQTQNRFEMNEVSNSEDQQNSKLIDMSELLDAHSTNSLTSLLAASEEEEDEEEQHLNNNNNSNT